MSLNKLFNLRPNITLMWCIFLCLLCSSYCKVANTVAAHTIIFLEMLGTNHPAIQYRILEGLNLQYYKQLVVSTWYEGIR